MSDQVLLWLVLGVVYGWECLCWLRRDSVAFMTWLGRRWRLRFPSVLAGNQRGGFVGLPPLPPLGTVIVAAACPVSLSPSAVLGFVSATLGPGGRGRQSGAYFRIEDLSGLQVRQRTVLVQGRCLAQAASVAAAHGLAANLRTLAGTPAAGREEEIHRQLRSMFDLPSLQAVWKEFLDQSVSLRRCTNALFLFLFMVAPAVIWFFGLERVWIPALIVLLALTITTATLFGRLHRKFFPDLDDERFTHIILIALSPATSIRAADTVSRPLLHRYHPLVVGWHLLEETAFRAFARRTLIELRHPALPVCPHPDPAAQAAELFWRSRLLEQSEEFLRRQGISPEELLAPPAIAESDCVAYCPRCRTQFTTLSAQCADCGSMPVLPLATTPTSRS
jgi:hypothetical protein